MALDCEMTYSSRFAASWRGERDPNSLPGATALARAASMERIGGGEGPPGRGRGAAEEDEGRGRGCGVRAGGRPSAGREQAVTLANPAMERRRGSRSEGTNRVRLLSGAMDPLLLKGTCRHARPATLTRAEYAAFLAPSFDADAFAHAIISRDAASSLDAGPADLAPMLAKLNFGVQDLTARIKQEVRLPAPGPAHDTTDHDTPRAAAPAGSVARSPRGRPRTRPHRHQRARVLSRTVRPPPALPAELGSLRRKISVPHAALSSSLIRLKDLEHTSSLAKRAWRFSVLARRLDAQMIEVDAKDSEGAEEPAPQSRAGPRSSLTGEGSSARGSLSEATGEGRKGRRERAMAEAALTLAEIGSSTPPSCAIPGLTRCKETLLEEGGGEDEETGESLPIKDLKAIAVHVPAVQASRHRVVEEMETTVHRGLDKLVRSSFRALPLMFVGQPAPGVFPADGAQSVGAAGDGGFPRDGSNGRGCAQDQVHL